MHLVDLLPDKRRHWVTAGYDALGLPEDKRKHVVGQSRDTVPGGVWDKPGSSAQLTID